jgi:hypothetical protein
MANGDIRSKVETPLGTTCFTGNNAYLCKLNQRATISSYASRKQSGGSTAGA